MKKILTIFFFSLLLLQNFCLAQFKKQLDSLTILSSKSPSDSDKVVALGKIATLYYAYKFDRQADSVLKKQLLLADNSGNNNLVLIALFGDAITNISSSATIETFNNTVGFIQKGINHAKSSNKYEYIALGYSRMANLLRKRGQSDNALRNAQIALGYLPNIKSDSIKAVIYIELGNTYKDKGDAVSAFTNYNSAFDIAFKIKSVPLQSTIYHCFSEIYKDLGQDDAAKDELKKSLALDKQYNYSEGIFMDYYDLARLTDEKFYIDRSLELSDSLQLSKNYVSVRELMLAYLMYIEKNSEKALAYLNQQPDLIESYLNIGKYYYHRKIGQIFLYSNNGDSALYYLKLAEYDYVNNFDKKIILGLFLEIAESFKLINDIPNAISYYSKALDLSKKINDISRMANAADKLSNLYNQRGNYEKAFEFSKLSIEYKDSLKILSKEKDIALLNVEREKRKHEEEIEQEQQRLNNKRNIQYKAITIAIALIFILILIIGMFPISKLTIKLLGYIFFISLFEFIVLLIYTFVYKITHGEPLKIWLIKIVVIALLVPLQHFLEHKLIKFLESRKLLKARTNFSFKKWFQKAKQPASDQEADFEKDTAVL